VTVAANMLQVFGTNKRRTLDEWTIDSIRILHSGLDLL
jgi:hypothetical protein